MEELQGIPHSHSHIALSVSPANSALVASPWVACGRRAAPHTPEGSLRPSVLKGADPSTTWKRTQDSYDSYFFERYNNFSSKSVCIPWKADIARHVGMLFGVIGNVWLILVFCSIRSASGTKYLRKYSCLKLLNKNQRHSGVYTPRDLPRSFQPCCSLSRSSSDWKFVQKSLFPFIQFDLQYTQKTYSSILQNMAYPNETIMLSYV